MTITSARLAELQAKYPEWHLWFVSQVYGPGWWCGAPVGTTLATVNKHSADELDEWLGEQP